MLAELLFGLMILIFIIFLIYQGNIYENKKSEKNRLSNEKEFEGQKKLWQLQQLSNDVQKILGVKLETISEKSTQDEIIRVVNLIAAHTAIACVNQDKSGRGEKPDTSYFDLNSPALQSYSFRSNVLDDKSWNKVTEELKKTWFEARRLAIQIAPHLEGQLPHFSEFEPLKSYRERYIQQKAKKLKLD